VTEEEWRVWEQSASEELKNTVEKEVFKAQYDVVKSIIQRETKMNEPKLSLGEMRDIAQQREQEAIEEFLNSLPKPVMTKEELKAHHEKLQQEHLKEIQEDDPWKFMVAWNMATGEGSTYCLYMTATDDKAVAKKRFEDKFGYYANFMDFTTREEFFDKFSNFIPESVKELSNKPCSLEFYTEVSYNFS
jgi:hypothetical protein